MGKRITQNNIKKGKKISAPSIDERTINHDESHPCFSFKYIQSQRHIDNIDSNKKSDLLSRFCKLSELSWKEIKNSQRHGFGIETINRESLLFSIPSTIEGTIFAFRYSGKLAMVGFRTRYISHIRYRCRF